MNVAADHADVVQQLAAKHADWAKTLAPLGEIPKLPNADSKVPTGHGWAFASSIGH